MNEAALDTWHDDGEIALEDYFGIFELRGTCSVCKKVALVAEFGKPGDLTLIPETPAPSPVLDPPSIDDVDRAGC